MAKYENLIVEIEGALAKIQLNRPKKKNSMSPGLHQDMTEALEQVAAASGVKALILTGVGDSFCGGMDLENCFLKPFSNPDEFRRINEPPFKWFKRLKSFPTVTIASVNGWCFGGGFEIAGACDIIIAANEATFGLSEINFGIFPGGGTMWVAAHNLDRKRALYYALTGDTFNGKQAVEYGFANFSVPRKSLNQETARVAAMITNKNALALTFTKEVYERSMTMNFAESIDWEMAKLMELSYFTRHEWINVALKQFSERKYRPGLDSYELPK
jgi:trans-feruloyl-CoA hydratase/vanillin synthase